MDLDLLIIQVLELSSNPKKPSVEFAVPIPVLYVNPSPRSVLVSVACTTENVVCVLIPATVVPWKVSIFAPVFIAVTVVIPLAEKLECNRVSLTAIPVT